MDPIQVLGKTQPRTIVIEGDSEKSGQLKVDLARVKNTIAGDGSVSLVISSKVVCVTISE